MLRSVSGVLVGYLIFALSAAALFALSGKDPHAPASPVFMIGSILYGVAFSTIGGYVAALIGRRFEVEHSLAVAALIAVLGAASLLAESAQESKWTQLGTVLVIAPAAMLGGYFRQRQVRAAKA